MDQDNPPNAEPEDDIYTGVDCCRDARDPAKSIRIVPAKATIKPGGSITLRGERITRECEPGCFSWTITRGGGTLSEEFGHATEFFAVDDFEECQGSACVALHCSGAIVDECYIGVNEYTKVDIAFSRTTSAYVWIKPGEWLFGKIGNTQNVSPKYDMLCLVHRFYDCTGDLVQSACRMSMLKMPGALSESQFKKMAAPTIGQFFDLRTDEMKEAHCCPPDILAEEDE